MRRVEPRPSGPGCQAVEIGDGGRDRLMRHGWCSPGTAAVAVLAVMIAGCSNSSGNKAGSGAPPSPSSAAPSASTGSPTPSPTPSSGSPTPSGTATPTAVSTPPACHPRVGKCLTVLSAGDAINVRAAPNIKAKIIRTISSGYQVEVLCVGKGQSVAGPKGRTIYWDAVDQGWISDAYVGASGKVKACE